MRRLLLVTSAVLGLGIAPVWAGPCTTEILNVEKAVNAPNSPYAPTARQSVGAQMGRQPTPSSVARAEEKADYGVIKEKIRIDLKRYIQKNTSRRPLIMPVILEI